MDLYILRHAIAEPRGHSIAGRDTQRPLTAEGERKMRRVARGMKAANLSFDLILSSPYLRARQTAEVVVEILGRARKVEFSDTLAADGNPKELINGLRKTRRKRVLLVGHEPYLSRLISFLISGGAGISINLRKGGLCKLTAESLRYGRCATLEWLLTPRQMRQLG
jgi:phosphohistidine phosphatase